MVTEFVKKLLSNRQLSRPLSDRDRLKEKKPLKGVKVPLSYEEHTGYEITRVSVEPQSKLKFTHERYNIGLRDVAMPALQSGRDSKPAYLPMEVPVQMVKHNGHNKDELIQREFGMTIREDMTLVNARVLWPPLKMFNGVQVDFWAYVDFSLLDQSFNFRFCEDLVSPCNSKGVHFHPQPLLLHQSAHPGKIERVLGDIHKMSGKQLEEVGQKGRHLQLLIIILPDVTGLYEKMIKRFRESELGVVSQCCQPTAASRLSKQYLENLSLELSEVWWKEHCCHSKKDSSSSDIPTIIFAADVTHPQPGKDSSLSIAAVVACIDWPQIIQDLYSVNQDPNNGLVGGGMIREHFRAFRQETGRKPERIIFYIDGVSEEQFCQVLLYEMDAIRKACQLLLEGYLPPLTFVVAQTGTVADTQFCHPREFNFYLNSHASIQVYGSESRGECACGEV